MSGSSAYIGSNSPFLNRVRNPFVFHEMILVFTILDNRNNFYTYIPYSLYVYVTLLMIVFYFQRRFVDKLRKI